MIGFDFAGKLPTGASISSASLSAVDLDDDSDQTAVVLQTAVGTISGTQVLGRVLAGVLGHLYKVRFLVTLSTGEVLLETVLMLVVER